MSEKSEKIDMSDLLEDLDSEDLDEIEEMDQEEVEQKKEEKKDDDEEEDEEEEEEQKEEEKKMDEEPQRGIVYLSIIHKGLNPGIIKGMCNNYGKVTRMHFVEDKRGKNMFKEGWIEFETEKQAKIIALSLNGKRIGGKHKHSGYYDKLWNMKFINGLTWNKIFEERERKEMMMEQQIDFALRKVKKETESYLLNSQKARNKRFAEKRKAKKEKKKEESKPKKNEH